MHDDLDLERIFRAMKEHQQVSLQHWRFEQQKREQQDQEARKADPDKYWIAKFKGYKHASDVNLAYAAGADCLNCATSLKQGIPLGTSVLASLLSVMSRLMLQSTEICDLINAIACARMLEFSATQRATLARAYANLRCWSDALMGEHRRVCLNEANWHLDHLVSFLWAHLVAEQNITELFGHDVLGRCGDLTNKQFQRGRELNHLRIFFDLELPRGMEEILNRPPQQKLLIGPQSELEKLLAKDLRALGRKFSQQAIIGGYRCDFLVDMPSGPVIIEALGITYHFLRRLRPLGTNQNVFKQTQDLRGDDELRKRVFEKLGFRTLFMKSHKILRTNRDRRLSELERELKGE